ncbi:hypothetical protein GA0074695_0681 [Micromonospora viridifaciens]|uniref:Uncharacterized protein n=1 Tax=Micromonospora viridifaciens TaxID=1881 RepID=A0A1C4UNS8_MICVI|nr:hypothetical protein GA0074695_0681 [Micromonospora viridifaciens]
MAFLPLSGRRGGAQTGPHPVHAGGETDLNQAKVGAAMTALLFLLFLLLLAVASAVGLTVDTWDSADWKQADGGRRWSSRTC